MYSLLQVTSHYPKQLLQFVLEKLLFQSKYHNFDHIDERSHYHQTSEGHLEEFGHPQLQSLNLFFVFAKIQSLHLKSCSKQTNTLPTRLLSKAGPTWSLIYSFSK